MGLGSLDSQQALPLINGIENGCNEEYFIREVDSIVPQVTLRYIGITQDMKGSTIRKLSFKR